MRVVFLAGAQEDLRELRRYIVKNFGPDTWRESYAHIKTTARNIGVFPEIGVAPDELAELGMPNFRQALSGLNRMIYELGPGMVYIHIVCDARRDLRTVLARRMRGPV